MANKKPQPEWNGNAKKQLIIWSILTIVASILYFIFFTGEIK